jgi:hypothetical protein
MSRFTIIVPVILKYYPSLSTGILKPKEEVMAGSHKRENNHA